MNDRILSKEDILCMQYAGMKSSRIMNPDLPTFAQKDRTRLSAHDSLLR